MSAKQPDHRARFAAPQCSPDDAGARMGLDESGRRHGAARAQRPGRRGRQQQEITFAERARLALRHLENTASTADQTEYGALVGGIADGPIATGLGLFPEQAL